jgi:hypothetical protein
MYIENEDRLQDYFDNMLQNGMFGDDGSLVCPDEPNPPSTEDMTVYDLMGDDYYPYITKNSNGDYTITIENYQNEVVAENSEANMCVLDGFADFCRRYLTSYERLNQK